MNLSEINWDLNEAGSWPLPIKAAAIAVICVLVFSAGVYYDTLDQLAALDVSEKKERELKQAFETKQKKSINLQDYQDQLTQIETELEDMIRQMPTKEELASLLIDISQTGLASGLEFRLFKPGAAIRKDFYSELPIEIEVIGKYEELGLFVSGLASLPRIVTVHDVNIIPESKDGKTGEMKMNATVKTYNESVDEAAETAKKKRARK
ncbi:MAG: type 4a pilus biogenesis protein PilO [Methylobacter tundripaludum]|uniref:Type IV pilus assembly protein PilO n=1 Tax=Methylobacter tundripaludum TaxID=173365 RepID=A0A2S6GXU4_9GAMM|nr:type 4a pilus biogenesis protein PilO [Methylobacter tundripaludum]MCK9636083.1 type 4a pilus biogenesis protein PilO [Methylobacter tundripaludum]PPK70054.1 type IV pilus assembly protein PilO [Methylobacter tundripaludum]